MGGGLLAVPTAPASAGTLAATVRSTRTTQTTTCSNAFLDGDSRLGPEQLADAGPVAPIVRGYNRLAGLTADQFIATFWDPTASGGRGGWRFPPDNGFLLGTSGNPIESAMPLAVGREIDRFGSEFGAFLAPLDTPYASRALPPQSLDNFDAAFTCNYHVYKVVKSFTVEAGAIAPGFGQRGLGVQYQLVGSLLPGSPATANVMYLINNGFIVRVNA
jgi:hypothetical protein